MVLIEDSELTVSGFSLWPRLRLPYNPPSDVYGMDVLDWMDYESTVDRFESFAGVG